MAHGSSFTLSIELQQDDGKVAESECLQETPELSRKIHRCQVLKWAEGVRGPRRPKLGPRNIVREASRPQPWQEGQRAAVCRHTRVQACACEHVCCVCRVCSCPHVSRTPQSAEDGDRAATCVQVGQSAGKRRSLSSKGPPTCRGPPQPRGDSDAGGWARRLPEAPPATPGPPEDARCRRVPAFTRHGAVWVPSPRSVPGAFARLLRCQTRSCLALSSARRALLSHS